MTEDIPQPVDGKTIFQINPNMRVRFNADGWVEEIGKGGSDDPLGSVLQGRTETKLDDVYARRFYDLYARAILLELHPKRDTERSMGSAGSGLLLFSDLDPKSVLYARVGKIIAIANHHFNLNIAPLQG